MEESRGNTQARAHAHTHTHTHTHTHLFYVQLSSLTNCEEGATMFGKPPGTLLCQRDH